MDTYCCHLGAICPKKTLNFSYFSSYLVSQSIIIIKLRTKPSQITRSTHHATLLSIRHFLNFKLLKSAFLKISRFLRLSDRPSKFNQEVRDGVFKLNNRFQGREEVLRSPKKNYLVLRPPFSMIRRYLKIKLLKYMCSNDVEYQLWRKKISCWNNNFPSNLRERLANDVICWNDPSVPSNCW